MFHQDQWPYTFYAYPDVSLVATMVGVDAPTWPGAGAKPCHQCCSRHCYRVGLCRALHANNIIGIWGNRRFRWTFYCPTEWTQILAYHLLHYAGRQGVTLKQPLHIRTLNTTAHSRRPLLISQAGLEKRSSQGCRLCYRVHTNQLFTSKHTHTERNQ